MQASSKLLLTNKRLFTLTPLGGPKSFLSGMCLIRIHFIPCTGTKFIIQMMLLRNKAIFPVKNVIVDLIYLFLWQCSGLIYCPIKQTLAELLSGRKTTISSKHKQSTWARSKQATANWAANTTSFPVWRSQWEAGWQVLGECRWLVMINCQEKWSGFGQ